MSHFAQQLEKDEVPLLKLGGLPVLRGPREAGAFCPAGHHIALHQQLIVCNTTRCKVILYKILIKPLMVSVCVGRSVVHAHDQ